MKKSLLIIIVLMVVTPLFMWNCCRIEPGNGQIAVLMRKTGKLLPPENVIALEKGQRGIQLDVLGEGRYFRNPYTWDWKIMPVTEVPAGQFAVLVRKYGKDLEAGRIIAETPEYKGIIPEVLGTGRHRINPYAYEVRIFDDIKILPGNVGVVTNLTGNDIFTGKTNDFKCQDGFLVSKDRKGVVNEILKEGTHRLNPFIYNVIAVNTQSQRHEFAGDDAISFLTMDGFTVSLEGTVEFNVIAEEAPRLVQAVGDMEDILNKIILPSVHGFARIEGSKKGATEFIVGESRRLFQEELEKFLRENCRKWGIEINSVLIRDIIVPQDIAGIIRKRELAQQEARKYSQEIQRARSEAELARQKMLADQNLKKIAAETEKMAAIIKAKQEGQEAEIAAQTQLKVAEVEYRTAEAKAKASILAAEAQKRVIAEKNRSEAEVMLRSIEAYGSGENYVNAMLYRKMMPNIRSIIYNGAGQGTFGLPIAGAKQEKGGDK
ncbi:MAG: hypothetical protein J5746_11000 [Victivallales bacterium]|nr:hypothetical protein [Victivallales bacterium]